MKIQVQVSLEDIKNGIRLSETDCPIALAIKRQGYPSVEVGPDAIIIEECGEKRMFQTPEIAKKFMESFDGKEKVSPLNFEMQEGWA